MAMLPPRFIFTTEPIAAPRLELPHREVGASVDFLGIVRELEGSETLEGLFYEAHEPMAHQQLGRIAAELDALHPISSIIFIHRTGWVPVGETSLFIRVLAAHRSEALAFTGAFIDRLKQDVPIWKLVAPPQVA